MRTRFLMLAGAMLLAACNGNTGGTGGGYGDRGTPIASSAGTQARVANWEEQWADAKRKVTVARAEAVAAGQPIAPQVDAEVTELLERDLQSPDPEVRIERLQDAVSDALRLAELVSLG